MVLSSVVDTAWAFLGVILGIGDRLMELTWQRIVIGVLLVVVTFVVTTGVVSFVVVKLPATYFHPDHDRALWTDRHRAIRWTGLIIKNLGGFLLVLVGIVMSLPGIPGPGLLTILFGIMLLDFPGKRKLEYNLVSRPRVLKAINQLRQRFNVEPMVLE